MNSKTDDFAEMAVELRVLFGELRREELRLHELADEVRNQANVMSDAAHRMEVTAARIQLAQPVADRLVADARRRAEMIGRAHLLLKALIPHEEAVRRMIADDKASVVELSASARRAG